MGFTEKVFHYNSHLKINKLARVLVYIKKDNSPHEFFFLQETKSCTFSGH